MKELDKFPRSDHESGNWLNPSYIEEFLVCIENRLIVCENAAQLINNLTPNCLTLVSEFTDYNLNEWLQDNTIAFSRVKDNHSLHMKCAHLNAATKRLMKALRTHKLRNSNKLETKDDATESKPYYLKIDKYPAEFTLEESWNVRLEFWKDLVRKLDRDEVIDVDEMRVRDDHLIEFYTYNQLNNVEVEKIKNDITSDGTFEWASEESLGNIIVENRRRKIKADTTSFKYVMFI